MKIFLEECGIDTSWMKAADMRLVLGNHHDLEHENTALEQHMHELGQQVLIYQSYTVSYNLIERLWGAANKTQSHCDYTFHGLDRSYSRS